MECYWGLRRRLVNRGSFTVQILIPWVSVRLAMIEPLMIGEGTPKDSHHENRHCHIAGTTQGISAAFPLCDECHCILADFQNKGPRQQETGTPRRIEKAFPVDFDPRAVSTDEPFERRVVPGEQHLEIVRLNISVATGNEEPTRGGKFFVEQLQSDKLFLKGRFVTFADIIPA